ncbi:MAG: sugar phosphate isomerase/epimerase family protein, partial [Planctomycetaceae bacterium]
MTVKQPPRLVCSLASLNPHVNDAALDGVVACGFSEVEVPIRTAGMDDRFGSLPWLTEESTPAQIAELRSRLEIRQLRPASCVCGAGNLWKAPEVERVRAKLRVAAALGAEVATLVAGDANNDDDYEPICVTLRTLAEEARQLNLLPCVEFARGLAHNHRLQLQLLSDVGHPALKASFDPGLLHLLNDQVHAEVALAKSCHLVRHVRLRDFGGLPGVRHFPPLG